MFCLQRDGPLLLYFSVGSVLLIDRLESNFRACVSAILIKNKNVVVWSIC